MGEEEAVFPCFALASFPLDGGVRPPPVFPSRSAPDQGTEKGKADPWWAPPPGAAPLVFLEKQGLLQWPPSSQRGEGAGLPSPGAPGAHLSVAQDGRHVAVVQGSTVWIVSCEADGSTRLLSTFSPLPAGSPGGTGTGMGGGGTQAGRKRKMGMSDGQGNFLAASLGAQWSSFPETSQRPPLLVVWETQPLTNLWILSPSHSPPLSSSSSSSSHTPHHATPVRTLSLRPWARPGTACLGVCLRHTRGVPRPRGNQRQASWQGQGQGQTDAGPLVDLTLLLSTPHSTLLRFPFLGGSDEDQPKAQSQTVPLRRWFRRGAVATGLAFHPTLQILALAGCSPVPLGRAKGASATAGSMTVLLMHMPSSPFLAPVPLCVTTMASPHPLSQYNLGGAPSVHPPLQLHFSPLGTRLAVVDRPAGVLAVADVAGQDAQLCLRGRVVGKQVCLGPISGARPPPQRRQPAQGAPLEGEDEDEEEEGGEGEEAGGVWGARWARGRGSASSGASDASGGVVIRDASEGVSDVEWLSELELVVAHRSGRLVVGAWPLLRQNLLGAYGIPCRGAPLLCRAPTSPSSPSLLLLLEAATPAAPDSLGAPSSNGTLPAHHRRTHKDAHSEDVGAGSTGVGGEGSWALCDVQQRSASEMVQILVEDGLLGAALALSKALGRDADDAYKASWQYTVAQAGRGGGGARGRAFQGLVSGVLGCISDAKWVISQCLARIPQSADVSVEAGGGVSAEEIEELLSYGLRVTDGFRASCASLSAAASGTPVQAGTLVQPGMDAGTREGASADSAAEDPELVKWMVRQRLRLLQYLERLHAFVALSPGRFSSHDFWVFRDIPLGGAAACLASAGRVASLHTLLQRFPLSLRPSLLPLLLFLLPETLPPHSYRALLPGLRPPVAARLRDPDWAETREVLLWCTTAEEQSALQRWAHQGRATEELLISGAASGTPVRHGDGGREASLVGAASSLAGEEAFSNGSWAMVQAGGTLGLEAVGEGAVPLALCTEEAVRAFWPQGPLSSTPGVPSTGLTLSFTPPPHPPAHGPPPSSDGVPLGWFPLGVLEQWFKARAARIEAECGILEHCVSLLDVAVHQLGLRGLQTTLEEYMELYHVVYESPSGALVAPPLPAGVPPVHREELGTVGSPGGGDWTPLSPERERQREGERERGIGGLAGVRAVDLTLTEWLQLSPLQRFLVVVRAGQQGSQGGVAGVGDSSASVYSLVDSLVDKGLPLLRRHLAGAREVWETLGEWMIQQLVPQGQINLCAEALIRIAQSLRRGTDKGRERGAAAGVGARAAERGGAGGSEVPALASPAADVAAELAEAVQLAVSCVRACSDMKAGNNTPSEWSAMERLLQSLLRCTEGVLHGSSRDCLLEMLHRLDASRWLHSYEVYVPPSFFDSCSAEDPGPAEDLISRILEGFQRYQKQQQQEEEEEGEMGWGPPVGAGDEDGARERQTAGWVLLWEHLESLQATLLPFLDPPRLLSRFCAALLRCGECQLAKHFLFPSPLTPPPGTLPPGMPPGHPSQGPGAATRARGRPGGVGGSGGAVRGGSTPEDDPLIPRVGDAFRLSRDEAKELVLETARELFYSSDAVDAHTVSLALGCLKLLPDSSRAQGELSFFSAIAQTLPSLGLSLAPRQLSKVPDRLEVVHQLLAANPSVHQEPDSILALSHQLGLTQALDEARVLDAVARSAATQGDFTHAYCLCTRLMRKAYPGIWDLCAALSRGSVPDSEFELGEEFEGEGGAGAPGAYGGGGVGPGGKKERREGGARLGLLAYALVHCDEDSLPSLLSTWQSLDTASKCVDLGRAAGLVVPGLQEQEALVSDLAAGRAAGSWEGSTAPLLSLSLHDKGAFGGAFGDMAPSLLGLPAVHHGHTGTGSAPGVVHRPLAGYAGGGPLTTSHSGASSDSEPGEEGRGFATAAAGAVPGGVPGVGATQVGPHAGQASLSAAALPARVRSGLQVGRKALAAVARDGDKWIESTWNQVPRTLLPFACLHLPWMLLVLRSSTSSSGNPSRSSSSNNSSSSSSSSGMSSGGGTPGVHQAGGRQGKRESKGLSQGGGMEVHPWLAARLNQLILHALGSCQVAPSDRLLVEGAKVSLREGAASQLAEGSSGLVGPTPLLPAPEEALAVAMLLHADDSIKAASALDMEIARHSDFASKRRLMLHLLQFGGIQATLLFCLPSARPGTASALTGRGNAGGAPARGATPPTTLLGPSPTPEADAEFLASVLQLSPDQLLRIVRARSTALGGPKARGAAAAARWAHVVEVTGVKLRTSEDSQLLRQALPHADAQRFAHRDVAYMEEAVCSLVDVHNPKREAQGLIRFSPAALSTALMLAELYHLDTWKVHLVYLSSVLVSGWPEAEVAAELETSKLACMHRPLQLLHALWPLARGATDPDSKEREQGKKTGRGGASGPVQNSSSGGGRGGAAGAGTGADAGECPVTSLPLLLSLLSTACSALAESGTELTPSALEHQTAPLWPPQAPLDFFVFQLSRSFTECAEKLDLLARVAHQALGSLPGLRVLHLLDLVLGGRGLAPPEEAGAEPGAGAGRGSGAGAVPQGERGERELEAHVSPDSAFLLADVITQLSDCAAASQFWEDPHSFPLYSDAPTGALPIPGSFVPPSPANPPTFPASGVYDRCMAKVLTSAEGQQPLSVATVRGAVDEFSVLVGELSVAHRWRATERALALCASLVRQGAPEWGEGFREWERAWDASVSLLAADAEEAAAQGAEEGAGERTFDLPPGAICGKPKASDGLAHLGAAGSAHLDEMSRLASLSLSVLDQLVSNRSLQPRQAGAVLRQLSTWTFHVAGERGTGQREGQIVKALVSEGCQLASTLSIAEALAGEGCWQWEAMLQPRTHTHTHSDEHLPESSEKKAEKAPQEAGSTHGVPSLSSKEGEESAEQEDFNGWDMDPDMDIDVGLGDTGTSQGEEGRGGEGGTSEHTPAGEEASRDAAQEASTEIPDPSGVPGAHTSGAPEVDAGPKKAPVGVRKGLVGGGGARRKLGVVKKGTPAEGSAAPPATGTGTGAAKGTGGTAAASSRGALSAGASQKQGLKQPLGKQAKGGGMSLRAGGSLATKKVGATSAAGGVGSKGGLGGGEEEEDEWWKAEEEKPGGGAPGAHQGVDESDDEFWLRRTGAPRAHRGQDTGAGAGAPGVAGGAFPDRDSTEGVEQGGWGEEWGGKEGGGGGGQGRNRTGEGADAGAGEATALLAHQRRLLEGLKGTLPRAPVLDVVGIYHSLVTESLSALSLLSPVTGNSSSNSGPSLSAGTGSVTATTGPETEAPLARLWHVAASLGSEETKKQGLSDGDRTPEQDALVVHLRHILRCQLWEQLTAAAFDFVATLQSKPKGGWGDEDDNVDDQDGWGVPQDTAPGAGASSGGNRPLLSILFLLRFASPQDPQASATGSGFPPAARPITRAPAGASRGVPAGDHSGTGTGCWLPGGVPSDLLGVIPLSLRDEVIDADRGSSPLLWGSWLYDWPLAGVPPSHAPIQPGSLAGEPGAGGGIAPGSASGPELGVQGGASGGKALGRAGVVALFVEGVVAALWPGLEEDPTGDAVRAAKELRAFRASGGNRGGAQEGVHLGQRTGQMLLGLGGRHLSGHQHQQQYQHLLDSSSQAVLSAMSSLEDATTSAPQALGALAVLQALEEEADPWDASGVPGGTPEGVLGSGLGSGLGDVLGDVFGGEQYGSPSHKRQGELEGDPVAHPWCAAWARALCLLARHGCAAAVARVLDAASCEGGDGERRRAACLLSFQGAFELVSACAEGAGTSSKGHGYGHSRGEQGSSSEAPLGLSALEMSELAVVASLLLPFGTVRAVALSHLETQLASAPGGFLQRARASAAAAAESQGGGVGYAGGPPDQAAAAVSGSLAGALLLAVLASHVVHEHSNRHHNPLECTVLSADLMSRVQRGGAPGREAHAHAHSPSRLRGPSPGAPSSICSDTLLEFLCAVACGMAVHLKDGGALPVASGKDQSQGQGQGYAVGASVIDQQGKETESGGAGAQAQAGLGAVQQQQQFQAEQGQHRQNEGGLGGPQQQRTRAKSQEQARRGMGGQSEGLVSNLWRGVGSFFAASGGEDEDEEGEGAEEERGREGHFPATSRGPPLFPRPGASLEGSRQQEGDQKSSTLSDPSAILALPVSLPFLVASLTVAARYDVAEPLARFALSLCDPGAPVPAGDELAALEQFLEHEVRAQKRLLAQEHLPAGSVAPLAGIQGAATVHGDGSTLSGVLTRPRARTGSAWLPHLSQQLNLAALDEAMEGLFVLRSDME